MSVLLPLRAALYARVSTDRQAQQGTIASQVDALQQRATQDGCPIPTERCFVDDGYRGSTLLRPALERLRDQASAAALDRVYVLAPDRLARHFASQALLLQEFETAGLDIVFLDHAAPANPEGQLLRQLQGIIAEYERTKILDRTTRGKRHSARLGHVSALSRAPYGYRYVSAAEGGPRFDVVPEQAQVVAELFRWVAEERLSLGAARRRLQEQGVPNPHGGPRWSGNTLGALLHNPAYKGEALYGKTRTVPRRPPLRAYRGQATLPRRTSGRTRQGTAPIVIAVPALVSVERFEQVAQQLRENHQRQRGQWRGGHLLAGLVLCPQCGYALHGVYRSHRLADGQRREYRYYHCGGRQVRDAAGRWRCRAASVPAAELEAAVWVDACELLIDPQRLEQEYQRRLQGTSVEQDSTVTTLLKQLSVAAKAVSRLIDAYSEGLLDKEEFGPRVQQARQRVERLQQQAQAAAAMARQQEGLRLALGRLQEFAATIREGLTQADLATRRSILRALIQQVEVGATEVKIVYRVPPAPFVERPNEGVLQDCQSRHTHPRSENCFAVRQEKQLSPC